MKLHTIADRYPSASRLALSLAAALAVNACSSDGNDGVIDRGEPMAVETSTTREYEDAIEVACGAVVIDRRQIADGTNILTLEFPATEDGSIVRFKQPEAPGTAPVGVSHARAYKLDDLGGYTADAMEGDIMHLDRPGATPDNDCFDMRIGYEG